MVSPVVVLPTKERLAPGDVECSDIELSQTIAYNLGEALKTVKGVEHQIRCFTILDGYRAERSRVKKVWYADATEAVSLEERASLPTYLGIILNKRQVCLCTSC